MRPPQEAARFPRGLSKTTFLRRHHGEGQPPEEVLLAVRKVSAGSADRRPGARTQAGPANDGGACLRAGLGRLLGLPWQVDRDEVTALIREPDGLPVLRVQPLPSTGGRYGTDECVDGLN